MRKERPVRVSSKSHYLPMIWKQIAGFFIYRKAFWDDRVNSGLRKTITDLGGNMQYLKDLGLTKR